MVNLLLVLFFVFFICFIDTAFLLLVVPKVVDYIDRIIKGELFLSVFEFFFAFFSLSMITVLLVFLIFKAV